MAGSDQGIQKKVVMFPAAFKATNETIKHNIEAESTRKGNGSGGGNGLGTRGAVLETSVSNLETNISNIRDDIRDIRNVGLVIAIALLGAIGTVYLSLDNSLDKNGFALTKVVTNQENIVRLQDRLMDRFDQLLLSLSENKPIANLSDESTLDTEQVINDGNEP